MFYNFQILCFALEHFIWILARLKHASASARVHLGHLLRHLVRSCGFSVNANHDESVNPLPLSLPRMKIKTDCSPKRLRKYHDRLETHRTSRSRVATPDCSIDLNRIVRGNGSFTNWRTSYQHEVDRQPPKIVWDVLITKPAKKALIQPMISVCGIIIAMFPFIMPIMPSMAAGSVIGLPAGLPRFSGSLRNVPSLYADTRYCFREAKAAEEMAEEFDRRLIPRRRDRCSRRAGSACFFGVVCSRTVA